VQARRVILAVVIVVILVVVGIGGFLLYNNFNNLKEENLQLVEDLGAARTELAAYGKSTTVLVAGHDLGVGREVLDTDFSDGLILNSMITQNYVTNPEDIAGYHYKLNISKGTPITWDLVQSVDVSKTLRYLDIVADLFPIEARVGDYYDFRILTPGGEDYIYLSKKRVLSHYGGAVRLFMDENDIHTYQSALVDAFLNPGTLLYVTKYVEPSMQTAATPYYPVKDEVLKIMDLDPNVITLAEQDVTLRRRKEFENGLTLPDGVVRSVVGGRAAVIGKLSQAAQDFLRQNGWDSDGNSMGSELEQQQRETSQQAGSGVTGGSNAGENNPTSSNSNSNSNTGTGGTGSGGSGTGSTDTNAGGGAISSGDNNGGNNVSGGSSISNPNANTPGLTGGSVIESPNANTNPGFFENNYNPGETDPYRRD